MINIPTILPIGILSHVMTHLLSRRVTLGERSQFTLGWHHFEGRKCSFVCCGQLHWVRVDYSCLFLQVEGIFLSEEARPGDLVHVLLLIL